MSKDLFAEITKATGLPEDLIARELTKILNDKGIARDEVTLDELRVLIAEYLREVIINAKEKYEAGLEHD